MFPLNGGSTMIRWNINFHQLRVVTAIRPNLGLNPAHPGSSSLSLHHIMGEETCPTKPRSQSGTSHAREAPAMVSFSYFGTEDR